jgi:hypothetical protein
LCDIQLWVQEENSSRIVQCLTSKDGYFYWHLPTGKYLITTVRILGGVGRIEAFRRFASFFVPQESSCYIGTLTLDGRVQDDFEEAVLRFKQKFPLVHSTPIKLLMHPE